MRRELRAGGDSCWVSAHLFSQGNLDRVLTGLVDPLLDELREQRLANRGFFLRYWDGGHTSGCACCPPARRLPP